MGTAIDITTESIWSGAMHLLDQNSGYAEHAAWGLDRDFAMQEGVLAAVAALRWQDRTEIGSQSGSVARNAFKKQFAAARQVEGSAEEVDIDALISNLLPSDSEPAAFIASSGERSGFEMVVDVESFVGSCSFATIRALRKLSVDGGAAAIASHCGGAGTLAVAGMLRRALKADIAMSEKNIWIASCEADIHLRVVLCAANAAEAEAIASRHGEVDCVKIWA